MFFSPEICGGDKNATKGCSGQCGNSCSDYWKNKTNLICPSPCYSNSPCECKDGYVYDEVIQRCILPDDCPPGTIKVILRPVLNVLVPFFVSRSRYPRKNFGTQNCPVFLNRMKIFF